MADENSSFLKNDTAGKGTPIAFQFSDVRVMAAKILKRATEQANRKLEAAESQAQDIEKSAFDDGVKKGHQEGFPKGEAEGRAAGEAAAREEFKNRVSEIAQTLEALVQELNARKIELQAQAESGLVKLALEIARRIVRHELSVNPDIVRKVLREAISLSTERADLVAHVNPEDIAVVNEELPALHSVFTDLGRVQIKEDETLSRGEVRLLGKETEVDMRMASQFEVMERALMGEADMEEKPDSGEQDA